MNRHQRRAQRAQARNAPADSPVGGTCWKQRPDPADPRFVLIEMRIPNGGLEAKSYAGLDASDRILRFCIGSLHGRAAGGQAEAKAALLSAANSLLDEEADN